MKLPSKFKTKLVNALKSGKYPQTEANLFDGVGYCCLGVACSVAGMEKYVYKNGGYIEPYMAGYEKVPEILREDGDVPRNLAKLNDEEIPFEVIAGFINENL